MPEAVDNKKKRFIAYFTMEIGLDTHIPTYAGGLGVLAGDTIKSFADLSVPVVAVTLLNQGGYFYQKINEQGMQEEHPVKWSVDDFLKKLPQTITMALEGRTITVQAWGTLVEGVRGSQVPVVFLDTNVPENTEEDRRITQFLYGGDTRYRFFQEAVLGIGGAIMLKKLGYSVEKYHLNEGHSALLILELLNEQGEYDADAVRERCVFTTHTPLPSGHDVFDMALVKKVLGSAWPERLTKEVCQDNILNMTKLALHFSKHVNGVAKKHGEVSQALFPGHQIDAITNGIHPPSWASEPFKKLFDTHIPCWRNDPFALRGAAGIRKKEIWNAHMEAKKRLLDEVNEHTNAGMDYD
ncbi:alpha-glucan family phosphorylase, partial [Candidatus Woesearchaeota archaeon CG_4_10_14_0_8_um_filter_47_5]